MSTIPNGYLLIGGGRMDPLLGVCELVKELRTHFWEKKKRVLDGVSLEVNRHEVLGLVGHNGAGKTTLFKAILGLISTDSGTVRFTGKAFRPDFRRGVGFLPESPYFYNHLTARESLLFYGSLFDGNKGRREFRQQVDQRLSDVGLDGHMDKPLKSFSKGMLQRFGIAQAMINDPEFLILDEPMSGLDPQGRLAIRSIILDRAKRGKTILFSSHIMGDVQEICHRVVVMEQGRLIASLSKAEMEARRRWRLTLNSGAGKVKERTVELSSMDEVNRTLHMAYARDEVLVNMEERMPSLEEMVLEPKEGHHGS